MNQISVICKAQNNPVADITSLLARHHIDIRDINFNQFGTDAILNFVADDYDHCLHLLTASGYQAVSNDTLLIEADDRLGMLADISRQIADLGVAIRSLTLMTLGGQNHVVAISSNNNQKLRRHFTDRLVN